MLHETLTTAKDIFFSNIGPVSVALEVLAMIGSGVLFWRNRKKSRRKWYQKTLVAAQGPLLILSATFVLCLLVAPYRIINDQRQSIKDADKIAGELRKEIKSLRPRAMSAKYKIEVRNKLAEYFNITQRLQNQYCGHAPVYPGLGGVAAFDKFNVEAHAYIRKEMGYSYGEQFLKIDNTVPVSILCKIATEDINAYALAEQAGRRLDELMNKLDGMK